MSPSGRPLGASPAVPVGIALIACSELLLFASYLDHPLFAAIHGAIGLSLAAAAIGTRRSAWLSAFGFGASLILATVRTLGELGELDSRFITALLVPTSFAILLLASILVLRARTARVRTALAIGGACICAAYGWSAIDLGLLQPRGLSFVPALIGGGLVLVASSREPPPASDEDGATGAL